MRFILVSSIKFYQICISPPFSFLSSLGFKTGCRFPVSCSEFAKDELMRSKSLTKSLYKISIRLLSCGPWNIFFRSPKGI